MHPNRQTPFTLLLIACKAALCLSGAGCQWFVDQADKEVYSLIAERQAESIGIVSNATIEGSKVPGTPSERAYSFTPPSPPPGVPENFITSTRPPADADTQSAGQPTSMPGAEPRVMTLQELVKYALEHARQYQTAKEDLYLSALNLTLERFLWTPQFMWEIRSQYANYGQITNFDRAMEAVSDFAVEQRLPYGGTVTARAINVLMRDLRRNITSGETGEIILAADIPLLAGAGRVAYESRYQAERDLIYAVRDFERFRRTFLDDIIAAYLDLLSRRQQIINAQLQVESLAKDQESSQAKFDAGRISILDLQRAQNAVLRAESNVVRTRQDYQNGLDTFKLLIGMRITDAIELADEDLFIREPELQEDTAINVGLKYRLDLLNFRDAVDDTWRGVEIAKNNMLPDLNVGGSAAWNTNPGSLGTFDYDSDRVTWRGDVSLEVPLQRLPERNELRAAMIDWQRSKRSYDLEQDRVRQEVRRAIRGLIAAREQVTIQEENVSIAEERSKAATLNFDLGRISNRDKVEAEDELLDARNTLAVNISDYLRAIVAFHRDTGTLRLDDEGNWLDIAEVVE